jgi:hypothetical protein
VSLDILVPLLKGNPDSDTAERSRGRQLYPNK